MSKVQYFTACPLDGFIADESNSPDWLFEVPTMMMITIGISGSRASVASRWVPRRMNG